MEILSRPHSYQQAYACGLATVTVPYSKYEYSRNV